MLMKITMKRKLVPQRGWKRDWIRAFSTVELPALVEDCLYTYNELFRHEGLAVCDEIVTRHNGTLDIANAAGGGVRVTVTLPRKAS